MDMAGSWGSGTGATVYCSCFVENNNAQKALIAVKHPKGVKGRSYSAAVSLWKRRPSARLFWRTFAAMGPLLQCGNQPVGAPSYGAICKNQKSWL
jgi:hypothetical protein